MWVLPTDDGAGYRMFYFEQLSFLQILSLGDSNGWMDLFTPPRFSYDGKEMVLILPQNQGGGHGEYRHVCIAEKSSGMEFVVRPITKGTFTVTEIVHFDPIRKYVYVTVVEACVPAGVSPILLTRG